jgi:hypothetical protein
MDSFLATIENYRQLDFDSLCLAHFGYIYDDEAKTILDEAVSTCKTWWQVFEKNSANLDDTEPMMKVILEEIKPTPIYPEIISLKLKILAGVMTAMTKLLRKDPKPLYEHLLQGIVGWLAKDYKISKGQTA